MRLDRVNEPVGESDVLMVPSDVVKQLALAVVPDVAVSAHRANVGPMLEVSLQVVRPVARRSETHVADGARVRLLLGVHVLVAPQVA